MHVKRWFSTYLQNALQTPKSKWIGLCLHSVVPHLKRFQRPPWIWGCVTPSVRCPGEKAKEKSTSESAWQLQPIPTKLGLKWLERMKANSNHHSLERQQITFQTIKSKKKAVPHLEWQTFDTQRPPHTANKCFNMIYVIIYNNIIYIIYTMFLCGKLVSSWIQHFHACSYVHGPESSLNQPEARDQSWQYVWPQLVKNAPLKKCLLRYPLATYRSRGKLPALLGKIVIISLQIIYKRTMLC